MTGADKYSLVLELEGLPRMTNPSGRPVHWAVRMKEAQKWKQLVALVVPPRNRPIQPLSKARLVFIRFSSVSPDADGLVSGFKHIVDGLVQIGVLKNDTFTITGMPEYRWERSKRGQGKVRVEVYEQ
jgi:hypothetical protein